MKIFYSDKYTFPLPEGHRFPYGKYKLVREKLVNDKVVAPDELTEPPLATREEILLVHTAEYFDTFENGSIDPKIIRMLGLPWSHGLHLRSLASVGGALASAEEALKTGVAGNLAGGTHHAFAGYGEGYCVYNDFGVVSAYLMKKNPGMKVAIVDLDVHQGNGTASILSGNKNVFILDMFGKKNYPFEKIPATISIGLEDGTEDDEYLSILEINLKKVFEFEPDIILYQAGVDALKEDSLGRLSLTKEGLKERDRIIFRNALQNNVPVSLGLGGGYSKPIEHTVEAYCNTYKASKEIFERMRIPPP